MSKMLEEMAERIKRESTIKRQEATLFIASLVFCAACPGTCDSNETCPHTETDEGALMMARWAVKQVAEALKPQEQAMDEAERKAIKGTGNDDALWAKYYDARMDFLDAYYNLVEAASCVEKGENEVELGVEKCEKKG